MADVSLNLSTNQVQQLREKGHCVFMRAWELAKPLPHQTGTLCWVRESVAKPRVGETAYCYRADGEEAGRFYHRNYHMPDAARRLRVEIVGAWFEYDDAGQWSYVFTLKRLDDAPVLSA